MKEKMRQYKAYVSWVYRLVVLAVLPILGVGVFGIRAHLMSRGMGTAEIAETVEAAEIATESMEAVETMETIKTTGMVFIGVMAFDLWILLLGDRLIFGPIYHKEHRKCDYLKSSAKGGSVFQTVLWMDVWVRFVVYTLMFALGALLLLSVGSREAGAAYGWKIGGYGMLSAICFHAVTELGIFVIRRMQNGALFVLVLYGLELMLVPAIAAILIGQPAAIWGMAVLYLAADIALVFAGQRAAQKLVAERWYCDSAQEKQREERSMLE